MPHYKHERHGNHIASISERETLESNGWVLVEEVPSFLEPVDKEPKTDTIEVQVRRPGRKPRITE